MIAAIAAEQVIAASAFNERERRRLHERPVPLPNTVESILDHIGDEVEPLQPSAPVSASPAVFTAAMLSGALPQPSAEQLIRSFGQAAAPEDSQARIRDILA